MKDTTYIYVNFEEGFPFAGPLTYGREGSYPLPKDRVLYLEVQDPKSMLWKTVGSAYCGERYRISAVNTIFANETPEQLRHEFERMLSDRQKEMADRLDDRIRTFKIWSGIFVVIGLWNIAMAIWEFI